MAKLPLFPLGLVAFPGEKLNLHIFEPRYKQLVKDSYTNKTTFGIPPVMDGKPLAIGTEMKLEKVVKIYQEEKMDIRTIGIRKFYLKDYKSVAEGKLYPEGEVEYIESMPSDANMIEIQSLFDLVGKLYELMGMDQKLPEVHEDFSIYQIAHKLGLDLEQEYELLKLDKESDRISFVNNHLETVIPVMKQMKELQAKIKMNGHFKNITPPEM